jgi:hypothetical protein
MGSELILALFGVGALAGWVILAHAERYAPHGRENHAEAGPGAGAAHLDPEKSMQGLASLGLSPETCRWILRTMTQASGRGGVERASQWIHEILAAGAEVEVVAPGRIGEPDGTQAIESAAAGTRLPDAA